MTQFRVTPGYRRGRDRLYVSRRDGTTVAWYDKSTSRVNLLGLADREDALAALAPYLTGQVTVGPAPVPTPADLDRLSLHPDDDLAPNRPGEALHAALSEAEALGGPDEGRRPGRFRRKVRRLSPRRDQDPRRAELRAQEILGERLDALEGAGWRVLHSIPLPGAARIDHLAIGPAGVLTVRTLPARDQRVRVTDPVVGTGHATPLPHLRWARRDAERASLALATAVRPVLAVVEAAGSDALPAPSDVRILRETDIPVLASLGGVLKPADIEALYATARDRHSWLRI
jgi:hypothetical protein